MSVLDRLVKDESFRNFDEVLEFVERLCKEHFMPLRISDSKSIEKYNDSLKNADNYLDKSIKFHHATFVCSHFGEHRSRSTGKRTNQFVRACKCPFFFKVSFERSTNDFRIKSLNAKHANHVMSEGTIDTFRRKERLNPDVACFIENALHAGAQPTLIRKRAFLVFGKDIPAKSIQNMRQKISGLPKDEWVNAAELLQLYAEKDPKNTIKVFHDSKDVITHIYIQLSIQKDLFMKFGHLVQYDGTHRTNKCCMPLYTLLIEDNFGVGQPVAYCFMREETSDSIRLALETFAKYNDISVTKTVVTDKDCAEISAFAEIFPEADQLLCHFHVLKAVDSRLVKAKLVPSEKNEIFDYFKKALRAKNEEELADAAGYLTTIEMDGLGDYFSTCWFEQPYLWCMLYRNDKFTKGNNTTNRLERYHSTMKTVSGHRSLRFSDLIQIILDIFCLRIVDRERKEMEASVKFPTASVHPILKDFSKKVTRYAYELVNKQMKQPKTGYNIVQTDSAFVITSTSGSYEVFQDFSRCSCVFYMNYRLPCRHILFLAIKNDFEISSICYDPSWNLCASNNESFEITKEVTQDEVSPIAVLCKKSRVKILNRDDMWNIANKLSKEWCNAVQDLPLPTFEGQINLMKNMISGARRGEVVVFDVRNVHEKKNDLNTSVIENSCANPTSILKQKINTFEDDAHSISAVSGDAPSTSTANSCANPTSILKRKINTIEDDAQSISAVSDDVPSTSTALSTPIKKRSLSNPLKQLALPYQKRYAGRPRKNGKGYFLEYKKSPKVFSEKSLIEKRKMFLSWIIGSQKASVIMDFEKKIEEEELTVIPDDVSNAVIEKVVQKELECFQSLFTPDAWASVLQTIDVKKKSKKSKIFSCKGCNTIIRKTNPSIACDSCLEWFHMSCEKLSRKPSLKYYVCITCRK